MAEEINNQFHRVEFEREGGALGGARTNQDIGRGRDLHRKTRGYDTYYFCPKSDETGEKKI